MRKRDLFDKEATEANIELNERLEDSEVHEGSANKPMDANETNLKIQKALNGENDPKRDGVIPFYISNETPAIKINRE